MLFPRRPLLDAELVRAVLQGRTQSFAVLVERYQGLVYHVLLSRLGQHEDAEDLSQETFLKAFRRLDELEEPAKFGPWLRRIAENLACSALRHRQAAAGALAWRPWPATGEDPERLFAAQEEHDLVWEAVEGLSLECREVVLLFYLEEYSQEQVAFFLDVSVPTVKVRLQRARAALREELAETFDRQVQQAVQARRPGKAFTRKVMSGLPLVPWHIPLGQTLWSGSRLAWGAAIGTSLGLSGVAVILGLRGEPGPSPSSVLPEPGTAGAVRTTAPLAALDQQEQGMRVMLDPPQPDLGEPGSGKSLFGGQPLSSVARAQQDEALRFGKGGRLVWEFGEGSAQGWIARESPGFSPSLQLLPTQVSDGVLRVSLGEYQPGRMPVVELVSPELGYEARLFDRVEARVRVVHPTPISGSLSLAWTTPLNRLFPGQDPVLWRRLSLAERQAGSVAAFQDSGAARQPAIRPGRLAWGQFTVWDTLRVPLEPGWQTLAIDGLGEIPGTGWEGELVDLRLRFWLDGPRQGGEQDREDYPQVLEIDRITLRHTRRPLAVTLSLPGTGSPYRAGAWLGQGRFWPLPEGGLQWPILGDLDGDGDLDLVVSFYQDPFWQSGSRGGIRQGWLTALNDGQGHLSPGQPQVLEERRDGSSSIVRLDGADLDQDGRLDLVAGQAVATRTFLNRGAAGFVADRAWPDQIYIGRGDLDGDGRVDLVMEPYREDETDTAATGQRSRAGFWRNYGQGLFVEEELEPPEGPDWFPYALDDFDGDGRAELVWQQGWSEEGLDCRLLVCSGYRSGRWERQAAIAYRHLQEKRAYYLWTPPTYLGDLDEDGSWELGVPLGAYAEAQGMRSLGLAIHRPVPDPRVQAWLPRTVHLRPSFRHQPPIIPQRGDLDRDGLIDPLFVDLNYRQGPHLRVLRGQRGDLPVEEGSYPLPTEPRGWAAGDLDNDGRPEVVVVVEGLEGAGVYVLRNLASPPLVAAGEGEVR